MPSIAERRDAFHKLHEAGCFVMPNPWNVGTARYFQGLGFKALATTSSGFAHAQGYADGAVPREMMLQHLREIVEATDLPVNADFEGGYADAPDGVAESVRLGVETGVAGLSIEDFDRRSRKPALRFRSCCCAGARSPRRNRQGRRQSRAHRTHGGLHMRPS